MLSSTVVAVFIALAYVIGSNGSDNTINSRFDTFSDRTNGLDDRTNGLGELPRPEPSTRATFGSKSILLFTHS